MEKTPKQVHQLARVLSPMTDLTGKRDYAPRRSCSGRDSTASTERKDYKPERQVLAKRVSKWPWYRRGHPTVCDAGRKRLKSRYVGDVGTKVDIRLRVEDHLKCRTIFWIGRWKPWVKLDVRDP
jgi:hypothetical protein